MVTMEIERYDSPYSKNHSQSSISTAPVVAPGGGCSSSSSCSCCCTSTFIIPEAIILNNLTKKSQLSLEEIFKKYSSIYGKGFIIIYILGVILAAQNRSSYESYLIYQFDFAFWVLVGLGILGVLGGIIINPIVVSSYCRRAIDYPENKKHIGLSVFLIGLLTTCLYAGTIVPLLLASIGLI